MKTAWKTDKMGPHAPENRSCTQIGGFVGLRSGRQPQKSLDLALSD